MNKSLAAHNFQLSADQGNALAQFNYGVMLVNGEGIWMNKSLAAPSFDLSTDQEPFNTQSNSAHYLPDAVSDKQYETQGIEALRHVADLGLISAQLRLAKLLRAGRAIDRNAALLARYLKLAADQGSVKGQIEYAEYLLHGDVIGNTGRLRESEHYLKLAVVQGDSRAQMRLGIALLCGLYGRFNFEEARKLLELASESGRSCMRFAIVLRDSLAVSGCEIMNATDFCSSGSIFSVLRSSIDESIPLIRILNSHLCDLDGSSDPVFQEWQELARFSIDFLLDLSQPESNPGFIPAHLDHLVRMPALRSLPTDLLSCNSISTMIPLIFRMYSIECSLYKNVNHFMRCFPMKIIDKFMKELGGILRYIYLLQSSIEYCSHIRPLLLNMIVYRGIQQNGKMLVPLYESMIGEVIVWPSFTSTSINRDFVISAFIKGDDSLLFEIALHPGDVAVAIEAYSAYAGESEILIAASSGFMVEDVEWIDINGLKIGQVRLSYCMSWYDFNIDVPPTPILV
jgi:TPR repeat protein